MKNLFLTAVTLSIALFSSMAEAKCVNGRELVKGHYRKNGKYVQPYYRTCADGNKNNNFGPAQYPGQNPYRRDADQDGIPNHIDRDDNNNGLSDNTDAALKKIFRGQDLKRVIVPQFQNHQRYSDYPIVKGSSIKVIIYSDRTAYRTTIFKWDSWGYCNEYAPNGAVVTSNVNKNNCREEIGTYYEWDSWGYCNEKSPEGYTVASSVDRDNCRAFVGRYFEWDSWGYCNEKSPEGYTVTSNIDRDVCRSTVGTKYEFDTWGYCNEKTPDGYTITSNINKDHCRYQPDANGNIYIDLNGSVIMNGRGRKSQPHANPYNQRTPGIAEQVQSAR